MMQKLRDFFEDDKTFFASTVIAAVCFLCSGVNMCFLLTKTTNIVYYLYAALLLLIGPIVAILYYSYVKHNKNVMKGLMPLLLALLFVIDLVAFLDAYLNGEMLEKIVAGANSIIDVAIIVVHFLINSDHHSSPILVAANQILLIIYTLLSVVTLFPVIFLSGSIIIGLGSLLTSFAYVALVSTIICIETRIDAFKAKRDESKEKQEFDSKMW